MAATRAIAAFLALLLAATAAAEADVFSRAVLLDTDGAKTYTDLVAAVTAASSEEISSVAYGDVVGLHIMTQRPDTRVSSDLIVAAVFSASDGLAPLGAESRELASGEKLSLSFCGMDRSDLVGVVALVPSSDDGLLASYAAAGGVDLAVSRALSPELANALISAPQPPAFATWGGGIPTLGLPIVTGGDASDGSVAITLVNKFRQGGPPLPVALCSVSSLKKGVDEEPIERGGIFPLYRSERAALRATDPEPGETEPRPPIRIVFSNGLSGGTQPIPNLVYYASARPTGEVLAGRLCVPNPEVGISSFAPDADPKSLPSKDRLLPSSTSPECASAGAGVSARRSVARRLRRVMMQHEPENSEATTYFASGQHALHFTSIATRSTAAVAPFPAAAPFPANAPVEAPSSDPTPENRVVLTSTAPAPTVFVVATESKIGIRSASSGAEVESDTQPAKVPIAVWCIAVTVVMALGAALYAWVRTKRARRSRGE